MLGNNILIIAGTLDGFSGFILSILMCKAMNRSITNVLFGGFGSVHHEAGPGARARCVRSRWKMPRFAWPTPARSSLCPAMDWPPRRRSTPCATWPNALEARGVTVKYGIHPVAGRMPGHMNVLLAEANVPYGDLYEMETINPELDSTDVAVVVGANDVVNPDARDNPNSPIAGMPIIEVDKAKTVIVLKRGQGEASRVSRTPCSSSRTPACCTATPRTRSRNWHRK